MVKFGTIWILCLFCSLLHVSNTSSIRLVQPNGVMLRVPYIKNETLADFKSRCNLKDNNDVFFGNRLLNTSLSEAGVQSNDIVIAKESRITYETVKAKFATLSSLNQIEKEERFIYDPPKNEVTVYVPNLMYDAMMQLSSTNQSAILLGRHEISKNRSAYYVVGCMDMSEEKRAIELADDLDLSIIGYMLSTFDSQMVTLPLNLCNTTGTQDTIAIRY